MVRVWVLLLACILLAYMYEKSIIKNGGSMGQRIETNGSSFIFMVLTIVLVCFAGLRTVMNDTLTYAKSFASGSRVPAGWSTLFNVDWSIGSNPGFGIYRRLIKTIFGSNSQIFLFISSVIVECSCLIFLRRYSRSFCWSIFTFISFGVYAFTMAAIKQTLSVAIGIWAIPCFLNKKYAKAILLLLVACLFHPYVLILGLLFFLKEDVWKKKTLLLVFGTVIIAVFFGYFVNIIMNVSSSFGEDYLEEYFTEGGVGIARIISYAAVPLVTFFARDQINKLNSPMVNICVNASILSACIMAISGMGGAVMLGRVPSYFDLFTCLTVPIVFSACEYKNRGIYKAAFVVLMLVFYYTYYQKYLISYSNGDWFADIYQHASILSLFGG